MGCLLVNRCHEAVVALVEVEEHVVVVCDTAEFFPEGDEGEEYVALFPGPV